MFCNRNEFIYILVMVQHSNIHAHLHLDSTRFNGWSVELVQYQFQIVDYGFLPTHFKLNNS